MLSESKRADSKAREDLEKYRGALKSMQAASRKLHLDLRSLRSDVLLDLIEPQKENIKLLTVCARVLLVLPEVC